MPINLFVNYDKNAPHHNTCLSYVAKKINRNIDCVSYQDFDASHINEGDTVIMTGGAVLTSENVMHLMDRVGSRKVKVVAFAVSFRDRTTVLQEELLGQFHHIFCDTLQDLTFMERLMGKEKVSFVPNDVTLLSALKGNHMQTFHMLQQKKKKARYMIVAVRDLMPAKYMARYIDRLAKTYDATPCFIDSFQTNRDDVIKALPSTRHYFSIPTVEAIELSNIFSLACFAVTMDAFSTYQAVLHDLQTWPVVTARCETNLLRDLGYHEKEWLLADKDQASWDFFWRSTPRKHHATTITKQWLKDIDIPLTKLKSIIDSRYTSQRALGNYVSLLIDESKRMAKIRGGTKTLSLSLTGSTDYRLVAALEQGVDPVTVITESLATDVLRNHSALTGKFDLGVFDQNDPASPHRAGWQFVYEGLMEYHQHDAPLIMDLSIERTFFRDRDALAALGMIPYTRPWAGFIHHTFNQQFGDNNCVELFKTTEFLDSLPHCRTLFVLSLELKRQVQQALESHGYHVPVQALVHPTATNVKKFDITLFSDPRITTRRLLHVGSWMRNIYTFYRLSLGELPYVKQAIRLPSMDSAFTPDNLLTQLTTTLTTLVLNNEPVSACSTQYQNALDNTWCEHFLDATMRDVASVSLLPRLSDSEYDTILSQSVVFLNLVDASAVNTLLECIVRYTPIIINRIPAVVELLGDHYPLYYPDGTDDFDISLKVRGFLSDKSVIIAAYHYLKSNVKQGQFNINTFRAKLIDSLPTL